MTNPTPTSAAAMTDDEIDKLWNECDKGDDLTSTVRIFARFLLAQAVPPQAAGNAGVADAAKTGDEQRNEQQEKP